MITPRKDFRLQCRNCRYGITRTTGSTFSECGVAFSRKELIRALRRSAAVTVLYVLAALSLILFAAIAYGAGYPCYGLRSQFRSSSPTWRAAGLPISFRRSSSL